MRHCFLCFVLVSASGLGGYAQTDLREKIHVHQHANLRVIDGAQNPELVPDLTAYRLYFVAVTTAQNPSNADIVQQKAHIRKLRMENGDEQVFLNILRDFRTQYDDLIRNYNNTAEGAIINGESPDYEEFLRQRDLLVQSTRDNLKVVLTAQGMSRLDTTIRSEKARMRVTLPTSAQ